MCRELKIHFPIKKLLLKDHSSTLLAKTMKMDVLFAIDSCGKLPLQLLICGWIEI
jgi:hypothetical protein